MAVTTEIMILIIETAILCIVLSLICFCGTGTDDKNLKSYSSYPDEVQDRIKNIAEYQGKFKESNKAEHETYPPGKNTGKGIFYACKVDLTQTK